MGTLWGLKVVKIYEKMTSQDIDTTFQYQLTPKTQENHSDVGAIFLFWSPTLVCMDCDQYCELIQANINFRS